MGKDASSRLIFLKVKKKKKTFQLLCLPCLIWPLPPYLLVLLASPNTSQLSGAALPLFPLFFIWLLPSHPLGLCLDIASSQCFPAPPSKIRSSRFCHSSLSLLSWHLTTFCHGLVIYLPSPKDCRLSEEPSIFFPLHCLPSTWHST